MQNQPMEFPRIPQDDHSKAILDSVAILGTEMLKDESEKARRLGKVLIVLGTSPYHFDFLYFLIHSKTGDMRTELCNWYNREIHSKGQDYMIKIANKECGGLIPWFNQFQLTFFHIKELGKENPSWTPMSDIAWGLWSSFFSDKKFSRFMDKIDDIVLNSQRDWEYMNLPNLN